MNKLVSHYQVGQTYVFAKIVFGGATIARNLGHEVTADIHMIATRYLGEGAFVITRKTQNHDLDVGGTVNAESLVTWDQFIGSTRKIVTRHDYGASVDITLMLVEILQDFTSKRAASASLAAEGGLVKVLLMVLEDELKMTITEVYDVAPEDSFQLLLVH